MIVMLITEAQSGFQKTIRITFGRGGTCSVNLLDLEMADDTTWKYNFLKDLHDKDLDKDVYPLLFKTLYSENRFRVAMGSSPH